MKSVRVLCAVVALSALPLVVVAAQSSGNGNNPNTCKTTGVVGTAGKSGNVPSGLAKKCPPAPVPVPAPVPPPPSSPPVGPHEARGVVFEDINNSGVQDIFDGEMGLDGWTVDLYWNGQVIASTTSGADPVAGSGVFVFPNLGNTTYEVCIHVQGGYAQTLPTGSMANGCNGTGYMHTFSGTFMTRWVVNFGEMLQ